MSDTHDPQKSALADLARAKLRSTTMPDVLSLVISPLPDHPGVVYLNFIDRNPGSPITGFGIDISLDELRKALWQAPPRRGIGAFEAAVSRVFAAAFKLGRITARDHDLGEVVNANQEDLAARAALIAFAPAADEATITEEDVEVGAEALYALWHLGDWEDLPDKYVRPTITEAARLVLEAVAAARQRATGSGVSADE